MKNYYFFRIKRDRNNLHVVKRQKSNWFGRILHRNCLLKHVIEGKIGGRIEVKVRHWRRNKKLLVDLVEKRIFCKLKREALDCALWRTGIGTCYGPFVRQKTVWMNYRQHYNYNYLLHLLRSGRSYPHPSSLCWPPYFPPSHHPVRHFAESLRIIRI